MAPTALQNITRALRETYILHLFSCIEEREGKPDRVYAIPTCPFRQLREELRERGWTKDPGDPAVLHSGAIESWREGGAVMPALQICFLLGGAVEIDLDFAAPLGGDVASLVVHGAEVFWHWLWNTKTNPKRMAKALDRRFGSA
jgi:hypothetical protein